MKSTKDLARQLGLLRRRSSTTKQAVTRVKKTCQIFAYLIVIDFESTCWKEKRNTGQEIIEFPAVLLNTSTGDIEAEFHAYVLPEEHPQLSAFCTELTGITQAQVEGGVPLRICLSQFSRWLRRQEEEKAIAYNVSGDPAKQLCTFVTWSDWDLSVCLHYECRRKQLLKPAVLNSWIDLRATYRAFYERKPNGLHGALQDVGIEFSGRQHSGLDDSRNTATLAWRMICDGCTLKTTRTMLGTQQLKRKQECPLSEQLAQSEARPSPYSRVRPQPDVPLADASSAPEDRLLSRTQAISEATRSASGGRFQIWTDGPESGPVQSIVNLKTSLPSEITKGPEDGGKRGTNPSAIRFLNKTRVGINTSATNTPGRSSDTDCTVSSCNGNCGRSVLSTLGNTVAVQKPRVQGDSVRRMGRPILTSGKDSVVCTQGNNTAGRRKPGPSPPLKRPMQSADPPAPSSRGAGSRSAPAVFKTPSVTPVRRGGVSRSSSLSGGLGQPRTPGSCPTSGGSSLRASPAGVAPKVTPPMCQCGRRARRRTVQSPGPNQSRAFFACALGRRDSRPDGLRDVTNSGAGCGFFRWASAVLAKKQRAAMSPSPGRPAALPPRLPGAAVSVSRGLHPAGTSGCGATPVGFTGKRLGVAMRTVLRNQAQMNA